MAPPFVGVRERAGRRPARKQLGQRPGRWRRPPRVPSEHRGRSLSLRRKLLLELQRCAGLACCVLLGRGLLRSHRRQRRPGSYCPPCWDAEARICGDGVGTQPVPNVCPLLWFRPPTQTQGMLDAGADQALPPVVPRGLDAATSCRAGRGLDAAGGQRLIPRLRRRPRLRPRPRASLAGDDDTV